MSQQDHDNHQEGHECANGDGAMATVERDGKWICTDCDMRDSGTKDLND